MGKKHLVIFYYTSDQDNEHLALKDYKSFYGALRDAVLSKPDLSIDPYPCATPQMLADRLSALLDQSGEEEFYLHFSGHGSAKGIPYGDMLLNNQNLVAQLNHDKVISCFFSSCESSELVALANLAKRPVVLGTLSANNIQNTFAIRFQVSFYNALIASRTFSQAFDKAVSDTNIASGETIESGDFDRGEGGEEIEANANINALQIVFATKADRDRRMVPTNFLLEMDNTEPKRPFCLAWSDDEAVEGHIQDAFLHAGYAQSHAFFRISHKELPLINNRGNTDPVMSGNTLFLIHCVENKILPNELITHLSGDKMLSMDQYKFLLCLKSGLQPKTILGSDALLKGLEGHIFFYQDSCDELFTKDPFIKFFDNKDLGFTDRKRIVLSFESAPNKQELVEVTDVNTFVRIFFARITNEFQVNFLINWLKDKERLVCPVLPLDTIVNPDMDILAELRAMLVDETVDGDLSKQFYELHKSGAILVIRNRSDDIQGSKQVLEKIIQELHSSSGFMGKMDKDPTMLFFLHGTGNDLPTGTERHILRKQLSKPKAVDQETIASWKNRYNPVDFSTQISKEIAAIADALDIEKYKECCPSHIIRVLCDRLKVPEKQIVDI